MRNLREAPSACCQKTKIAAKEELIRRRTSIQKSATMESFPPSSKVRGKRTAVASDVRDPLYYVPVV